MNYKSIIASIIALMLGLTIGSVYFSPEPEVITKEKIKFVEVPVSNVKDQVQQTGGYYKPKTEAKKNTITVFNERRNPLNIGTGSDFYNKNVKRYELTGKITDAYVVVDADIDESWYTNAVGGINTLYLYFGSKAHWHLNTTFGIEWNQGGQSVKGRIAYQDFPFNTKVDLNDVYLGRRSGQFFSGNVIDIWNNQGYIEVGGFLNCCRNEHINLGTMSIELHLIYE